ncbi:hypothetical protein QC761_703980 [Podospora bellae-mahoneyi]|uniref:F-box domain-containing protein n=1 Tax=Podospora bellae-mahoneyi TaxID=2093777 RepID=A0ABR0F766_9PEZI|nr:hypothetical protein QC761_703980 [Podospora bellae-mahoneyi]
MDITSHAAARSPLTLATLPPEILMGIVECLIPTPPEIGETGPVALAQMFEGEPWYEFILCRRALASLCLVTRTFREMAHPLLYRVIAITNPRTMLLLFRTLAEFPHYGLHTRFLSCHITLTRNNVIRGVKEAMHEQLGRFKPSDAPGVIAQYVRNSIMQAGSVCSHWMQPYYDGLPQNIFSMILASCKRVETLLLEVPICDEDGDYNILFHKMHGDLHEFDLARDPSVKDEERPYQHIHTLLLQGDTEMIKHLEIDECDCDIPDNYGVKCNTYFPLFAALPKLATVEVTCDSGDWTNPIVNLNQNIMARLHAIHPGSTQFYKTMASLPPDHPYLGGIKHIYLHNSMVMPHHLHYLLKFAPYLETLYVTPRRIEDDGPVRWPRVHGPEEEDHESLNLGLQQYGKKHLKNLDVGWTSLKNMEKLVGPEGRIICLPELKNLEKLCIQLETLYGNMKNAAVLPLLSLLPPNLMELTIEDWWWRYEKLYFDMKMWKPKKKVEHYTREKAYRQAAVEMLMRFAKSLDVTTNRLKKVMLVCKIPWTWVLEGAVEADEHFMGVKLAFEEKGVVFEVDCDEVEEEEKRPKRDVPVYQPCLRPNAPEYDEYDEFDEFDEYPYDDYPY